VTWFKVDDGFHGHPKVAALEDGPCFAEAVALWTLAGSWSAKHLTDGNVPCNALRRLVPFCYKAAAAELVRVGLWESHSGGWRFRDWTEYQPTKDKVKQAREKTRERVRDHRQRHTAGNAVTNAECNAVSNGAPDPTRPDLEIKTVSPPDRGGLPRDPMADHFRGKAPGQREDVRQLFDAWKLAVSRPEAKLRGARDPDAVTLAELIDLHGLEDCLRVAHHAPQDGMVSGRLDDKGVKHPSIRYIFGNADAFLRILHAAREAEGKGSGRLPAHEALARARAL
jgi:hypothetical protein